MWRGEGAPTHLVQRRRQLLLHDLDAGGEGRACVTVCMCAIRTSLSVLSAPHPLTHSQVKSAWISCISSGASTGEADPLNARL